MLTDADYMQTNLLHIFLFIKYTKISVYLTVEHLCLISLKYLGHCLHLVTLFKGTKITLDSKIKVSVPLDSFLSYWYKYILNLGTVCLFRMRWSQPGSSHSAFSVKLISPCGQFIKGIVWISQIKAIWMHSWIFEFPLGKALLAAPLCVWPECCCLLQWIQKNQERTGFQCQ